MANNYGTFQALFTPYTFDLLIKPVMMADLEHKLIEAGMGEIDAKRALAEGALDPNRDTISLSRHDDYLNKLHQASTVLSNEGIKGLNRKNLMDLKTMYNKEIIPIERAIEARHKLALLESQKSALDDSTIFSRRALDMSVDEFLANPELSPLSVSGKNLHAVSALAFSNLAKRLRAEGISQALAEGYLRLYKSRGRTEREALNAMLGPGAGEEFDAIFNNIAQSYGLDKWEDGTPKDKAMLNIYRGALSSIGQDDTNYMSDKIWELLKQIALSNRSAGTQERNSLDGIISGEIPKERELNKNLIFRNKEKFQQLFDGLNHFEKYSEELGLDPNLKVIAFKKLMEDMPDLSNSLRLILLIDDKYNLQDFMPQNQEQLDRMLNRVNNNYNANKIKVTEFKLNLTHSNNIASNIAKNISSSVSPMTADGFIPETVNNTKLSKKLTGIKELKDDGSIGKDLELGQFQNYLDTGNAKGDDSSKGKPNLQFSYADGENFCRLNISKGNSNKVLLVPMRNLIAQLSPDGRNLANKHLLEIHLNRILNDYEGYKHSINVLFSLINADANTKVTQQTGVKD